MASIYSDHYNDNRKNKKKRGPSPEKKARESVSSSGFPTLQNLTDADRRAIRRAQRDPDLSGYSRREYELQDGSKNYSEPHVLPPRDDLRKTRVNQNDPDIQSDMELSGDVAEDVDVDRIAASNSGIDLALNKVDQKLTEAVTVINNLKEACAEVRRQLEKEGSDEERHFAEQNEWIVAEALLPWLTEVDKNFDGILHAV